MALHSLLVVCMSEVVCCRGHFLTILYFFLIKATLNGDAHLQWLNGTLYLLRLSCILLEM